MMTDRLLRCVLVSLAEIGRRLLTATERCERVLLNKVSP